MTRKISVPSFFRFVYHDDKEKGKMKHSDSRSSAEYVLIILAIAGAFFCIRMSGIHAGIRLPVIKNSSYPVLSAAAGKDTPEAGRWYCIAPESAVDSTGEQWHGLLRIGTENKVIVYFYGGGVSFNAKSAAMGNDVYVHQAADGSTELTGICSTDERNPFHNWTILALPYSTADFHIGTARFPYTASDGSEAILHHNGYNNFRLYMREAMNYAGSPDTVLVAGWSAGGFGAAFLADTIFHDYFPDAGRKAVCVDSALLLSDHWPEIASSVWGAPEEIIRCWHSDNPVTDSLENLSSHYPDAVILYTGSYRDGGLVQYQNYLDTGVFLSDDGLGNKFETALETMVNHILSLPNSGAYIWADWINDSSLTPHTILWTQFYTKGYNGESCASWLINAINGDITSHGLELFETGIPEVTSAPALPE